MKKPLIALTVTMMIAGCSTLKTDQAIPLLQAETAKMLGSGLIGRNYRDQRQWRAAGCAGRPKTFISRHHGKRPYFRLLVADDAGNFRFVAVVERADLYAGGHA